MKHYYTKSIWHIEYFILNFDLDLAGEENALGRFLKVTKRQKGAMLKEKCILSRALR